MFARLAACPARRIALAWAAACALLPIAAFVLALDAAGDGGDVRLAELPLPWRLSVTTAAGSATAVVLGVCCCRRRCCALA